MKYAIAALYVVAGLQTGARYDEKMTERCNVAGYTRNIVVTVLWPILGFAYLGTIPNRCGEQK